MNLLKPQNEAMESVMCDVIKIRLKRRYATRSGKGNQLLNIRTAVEGPVLKLGLPNFKWSFYFILLLVASLLFSRIFMTSHMTLSSASRISQAMSCSKNRLNIFYLLHSLDQIKALYSIRDRLSAIERILISFDQNMHGSNSSINFQKT